MAGILGESEGEENPIDSDREGLRICEGSINPWLILREKDSRYWIIANLLGEGFCFRAEISSNISGALKYGRYFSLWEVDMIGIRGDYRELVYNTSILYRSHFPYESENRNSSYVFSLNVS
jgi:hypothetical protein